MKLTYMLLLLLTSSVGFSQKKDGIIIAFQKQKIEILLGEDNTGRKIILPSKISTADQLSITITNDVESNQWKRTFEIFDTTDQSLLKIQPATSSSYRVAGKQLQDLLKKGRKFSLYTMAVPADERLAATVRVRRVFVCGINVK